MAARVVVGVDGSPGGRAALQYAKEEARMRDAELEVVLAFESPASYAPYYVEVDWSNDRDQARQKAQEHLEKLLSDAGVDHTAEGVTARADEGAPAGVLLDASKGADLLVVGSRGHGGFVGMLLGSVSQHVVRHATCPVLVVPTPHD